MIFKNSFTCLALLSLSLAACGKADNRLPASMPVAEEEACETEECTEQSINAPVGEQPQEDEVVYDLVAENPSRESLRFPTFRSSWGLSRDIYEKAVKYYEANRKNIANPRYFAIVDFKLHSSKKRFFLFDLSNNTVERHNVAAGKNSDPNNDGIATNFSNTPNSKQSSLGFYRTLQTYNGAHGYSLRLDGLSPTNNKAYQRAIVVHPASYVSDKQSKAGRSWGCPALDPAVSKSVINKIKSGAILLIDR